MPSLHQLHVGSLVDVVIDKGVKIAHGSGHVGKRVVIICTGNPPLIIPFCNHLAGFEFDIKGLFVKELVIDRDNIAQQIKTFYMILQKSPTFNSAHHISA